MELRAFVIASLVAAASAQEPLHRGGPHGDYYYHGSGWAWWWFIVFFVFIIFLVACVWGGYSYGVSSTRQHVHGQYEVLNADGTRRRVIRYDEDVSSVQRSGDATPVLYNAAPTRIDANRGFVALSDSPVVATRASAAGGRARRSGVKLRYV